MFQFNFSFAQRDGEAEEEEIVLIALRLAFLLRRAKFPRVWFRLVVVGDVLTHIVRRRNAVLRENGGEIS